MPGKRPAANPPHPAPLRILFATPECGPWVKTGGLGDVCGALPKALASLGHEVRVLIPAFPAFTAMLRNAQSSVVIEAQAPWPAAKLHLVREQGVVLWLLDCPALYDRPAGPYLDTSGRDHADNAERFAFLSHVAARLSSSASPCNAWRPHVLHCHDWTTGLAPAYLKRLDGEGTASVITVHNLLFQGMFPTHLAPRLAIADEWLSVEQGLLHWDQLCFLKAALRFADAITTVSPTYAREIQQPEEGCGLDGMLRLRSADLVGILNGIDTDVWCPATDAHLPVHYDASRLHLKSHDKAALRERMGLRDDPGAMLLGLVSRLTSQKGIELVLQALPALLAMGCQLCVLGTGEPAFEAALREQAALHPGRVAVQIGFSESLAHLIEAGADAFLMPSLFEPCGLNQMYSQAYGTPPIVRAVGGLADSVSDATEGDGTGFRFDAPTSEALTDAVRRAKAAFDEAGHWRAIQQRAMACDNGWPASARHYVDVYRRAIAHRAIA